MKITILLTLLLFQTFAFAGAKDDAVDYFISSDEPKVKDALWTAENVFKVAVFNDRTNRDGYANYVCSVLNDDFSIYRTLVRVIDVVKVNNGHWHNLGTAYCD